MRANELMVGDWVYAIDDNGEKHPCRANNLEYDYTNKRGDFCDDFVGAANLQYVHELQHALRLCGINKEIVL